MFSTYLPGDVTLLLKDITGLVTPLGTRERERFIQSGVHYSEMLPLEDTHTPAYLQTYRQAVALYAQKTADAVATVAELIRRDHGDQAALVSLARAGTPAGILIKRYLGLRYGAAVAHYTVSVIRGKGIDPNAMRFLLSRHAPENLQFVDGWTGKGAICRELTRAMAAYPGVSPGLAVLADPAYLTDKCGTHEDFLIPSSCLNATVSGLLSRTFAREDIIGPDDFHGAMFYQNLLPDDLPYSFIDAVAACFPKASPVRFPAKDDSAEISAVTEVARIAEHFGLSDINLVKPGIGEATRVLLRRVPWKVLVRRGEGDEALAPIFRLAREKGVEPVEYPLLHYRACGLIRVLADQ
ncbi:MAG: cysteine protease StiP family protein [Clostridiales bacterium]|nr:cysteine protease StiP family protein [Clostridiales bacterium]